MKINRRTFIGNTAKSLGGLYLFGPKVFANPKPIKIGILAPAHCPLPIVYAKTKGLYKKGGVNVEIVNYKSMKDIVKDLNTGEIDLCQLTTPLAFGIGGNNPNLPNFPLVVPHVLGTNGGILAASTKSNIQKIYDLKGKKIGIHSPFMVHFLILKNLLDKYGLKSGKNIEIINIDMGKMADALKNETIDALIGPEPLPTFLEEKKLIKSLVYTRMFWLNHPCCVLAMKKSFFEKEPFMVQDLATATIIAGLTLDNPVSRKEAIADVHQHYKPYNQIKISSLYKAFKPRRSDFYPFPFRSAGKIVVDLMKNYSLLDKNTDGYKLVNEIFQCDFAMNAIISAANEVPNTIVPQSIDRKEVIKLL